MLNSTHFQSTAPPTPASNVPLPGVLFTSFEPSGDDHAAAVIAELRRRHPGLPIYAWGGPHMERAGATIVERTGENAVIGLPGPSKIIEHIKIHSRVKRWLGEGRVALHVPVDSPAANFPLCKLARASGIKVVHLVAPQIWAWGRWRINKLRRRTDLVLCLLPFEENWFLARGVAARFVGHPLFDVAPDEGELERRAGTVVRAVAESTAGASANGSLAAQGGAATGVRLALMPGSRPAEMRACFPMLLDAYQRLKADFPGISAAVAATKPAAATVLRQIAERHGGWPDGMAVVSGDTDAVIRWCDFALVVSGTVTLQVTRQLKPMVVVYRPHWLTYWLIIRWVLSTEMFALPNLIAGRRVVPELIPHFGNGEALAVEVIKLMRREGYADDQRRELSKIVGLFDGRRAAPGAADQIERMLGISRSVSEAQAGGGVMATVEAKAGMT